MPADISLSVSRLSAFAPVPGSLISTLKMPVTCEPIVSVVVVWLVSSTLSGPSVPVS